MSVGESVYIEENGTKVEYLIVQNGKPNHDSYDSSADGVWLLRNDCLSARQYNTTDSTSTANRYDRSSLDDWLIGDFYQSLNIKDVLKLVKITFAAGSGGYSSGSAQRRVFLLSPANLGVKNNNIRDDAALAYFTSDSNSLRIAKYNGSAVQYWTRDAQYGETLYAYKISSSGAMSSENVTASLYVRPTVVVPSDTLVDSNHNIVV